MPGIDEKLQRALKFHQSALILEAQGLYKEILQEYPQHFDSCHLLGVALIQVGSTQEGISTILRALEIRPTSGEAYYNLAHGWQTLRDLNRALSSLEKAIELRPSDPEYWLEHGNVLEELKRPGNALQSYDRAISLKPDYAEAYCNRGIALKELDRLLEALASYDRAISLRPDYAEAYSNRGNALKELNRLDEALANQERAISLKPDYAEAFSNRGIALRELNRLDEALESYDKAISLKPGYAEAYNNRGIVLRELDRLDEALASYDKAIGMKPDYAEAYSNRGDALKKLNRLDEALANQERAISLKPDYVEAYSNRGNVLADLNLLDEALVSYDKAISLKPESAEAHKDRGDILKDLNRLDEALASYDKAISLKSDFSGAYWNRSTVVLLRADFENGLKDYEYRKLEKGSEAARFPKELTWTGEEDLLGKTLFIYPELFLGDMIQFCRYAVLAEGRGAKVVLAAPESLHALLRSLSPTISLIPKTSVPKQFDYHCGLMSLPFAFKTRIDTIPFETSYLSVDSDRIEKWREKIQTYGFKVGICWQGSTAAYSIPMRRSLPLSIFENISRIPKVRLISLQKRDGIEQLSRLPVGMKVETLGDDYDAGPDAFLDAAAVMANLDLIVTVDTAIAHLAGALGHRTWVALKDVPDWRWLLDRSDIPWYPGMKLFRQRERDNWKDVFDEIETQLRQLAEQH